jgi:carbamate kinase
VPVIREVDRGFHGIEAVLDKDLTAALLATALDADMLLLTDVPAVIDGYGTPDARPIRRASPAQWRARSFPAGSMGPKVEAVCRFVEATARPAAIGRCAVNPARCGRPTSGERDCGTRAVTHRPNVPVRRDSRPS